MLNILKEQIKDKNVLILGYGREGHSTLHRVLEVGGFSSVTVADKNQVQLPAPAKALCGEHYMDTLDDYDLVFKSPGVVLSKDPEQYNCRFTSQMEVFFEAYRDRIIGITGTKGKSTTTTLLYHILKKSGLDTVLSGNIGIPAFDILEEIHPDTQLVCELSCHQLEYIHVSPHIGVLLNIHEEHLDQLWHHGKIYSCQTTDLSPSASARISCSVEWM